MMPRRHQIALGIGSAVATVTILNALLMPGRYSPHVAAEKIEKQPLLLTVRAGGVVEAKDSNTLRAQFDGPIEKKLFREGQRVSKGALLVVLGRDRIRLDFQSKSDALTNAKADYAKALKEVRLQKALFSKQAVAYSAVEDAQQAVRKAQQALRSAEEGLRQARTQWDSSQVYAPISGTIVKDWIGDEKTISAGKELVTVADVSDFRVRVAVDELDGKRIREGHRAVVVVQSLPGRAFEGIVTQVGVATEAQGVLPQVPILLAIDGWKGADLQPRMTAEVSIQIGATEPTISIPTMALENATGEAHVWVLDGLNRLRMRVVEVGRTSTDQIEILKGLSVGDRVVRMAEPDFAEGVRVVVDPSSRGVSSRTARLIKKNAPEARPSAKKPASPRRLL